MAYIPWWQRMTPPTFAERFDLGGLAGRVGFKGGTNPAINQGFQVGNPGNIKSLEKLNLEKAQIKNAKKLRAKVLLKDGKSKAQATKIIVKEFKLTRHPFAGTAPWMKDAATELITEGYEIVPGKIDTGSKSKAHKFRKSAIGKGEPFEWRMKKIKTKSGLGKIYEAAHTANIFQAKKLGIEYPIDAIQLQLKNVNQEVAELLNDELKPLYKKQYNLVNKLKKKPTPALRKSLDQINYQIAELVSSGGTQGKKAANVLRAIQVDPFTLKGRVAELGFNTLQAIDKGMTGATTKGAQFGTEADALAKANYSQLLKEKKLLKQIAKKSTKSAGAKLLYPAMLVNQLLFGDKFSKGPWDFPLTITEDVKQTNELLKMIGDKVNLAAGGRVSYLDGGIASLKK